MRKYARGVDMLLIFAFSIVLSLVAAARVRQPIAPDSPSYIVPARNLLAGRGFSGNGALVTFLDAVPGYPNRPGPEAMRTPGYPLLIAASSAAGAGLHGVIVFQRILNVLIALGIYIFAMARARSREVALIAAVLYLAFPATTATAELLLAETLFTALMLAAIVLIDAGLRGGSIAATASAGLLIGAAVMVRPIATYYFIALLPLVFVQKKRRTALVVTLLITSLVIPISWAARNQRATGVFTVSTIDSENLLFQWAAAVHATRNESHWFRLTAAQQQMGFRSTLHRAKLPLFYQAMAIARHDGLDPVQLNQARKSVYERSLALHIIEGNPVAVAELAVSGVAELLLFAPATDLRMLGVPASVAVVVCFLLLAVFGVRRIYASDPTLAWLTVVTIAYFTVTSAIPETTTRYALVFAPLFAICAAAGVADVAPRALVYSRALLARASSRASRRANSGPA